MNAKICSGCGIKFAPIRGSKRKGLYCTRECAFRNAPYYQRKAIKQAANQWKAISDGCMQWLLAWRDCKGCGKAMYGSAKASTCSRKCESLVRHRKQIKWECRGCGSAMKEASRKTLCGDCKRSSERTYRLASKESRRRRIKENGPREIIRPFDVFNRDGWVCQLCNEECLKGVLVPDPRAATIDHILPLSKGGIHVMANVQCACFACNSVKGDAINDEEAEAMRELLCLA